jgi:mannose/fructose/N-acetylgalactosamine-specific phosphotransferase system component IID
MVFADPMSEISRFGLFRLYWRSFFVQNGWSYERMMALGFLWILKPLTKRLFPTTEEQRGFLKRHLLSFNANPYLVNYVVGAVVRMEEEKTPEEEIIKFKSSLRGPVGAIGDRLIWQNLRPALLILGLILAVTIGFFGALIFWIIFNLYQAFLRARGIVKGYDLGSGLSGELAKGYLQSMTEWSSRLGAVLLGIIFVIKLDQLGIRPLHLENIFLLPGFILLSVFAFRKNINPNYTILISIALFLAIKAGLAFF